MALISAAVVPSFESKIDVRIDSPRKLFRQLHDLMDEKGYQHEYKPLRIQKDAITDTAIFESELVGKKDTQGYDKFKLILAIACALTILLIPVAAQLLKSALYPLRIVVKICVEGEAYKKKISSADNTVVELLDISSDARVTLHVNAGVGGSNDQVIRPTKIRREMEKLEEEGQSILDSFVYVLLNAALSAPRLYNEILTRPLSHQIIVNSSDHYRRRQSDGPHTPLQVPQK